MAELKRRTPPPPRKTLPLGNLTALIDGDIIQYKAASVCDVVSYEHDETGAEFHYHKEMKAYCEEHGYPLPIRGEGWQGVTKHITPEPIEFCLHTIKKMLEDILEETGASDCRIFLTGKGNYREAIATRFPYKGQRSREKPTHFKAAGEYLRDIWHAETINGREADDALGYEHLAAPDTTIICTTDKDLKMIPGKHYGLDTREITEVSLADADRFFYCQLLAGDNIDNIRAIDGIGLITAYKKLEDCETPRQMYERCVALYEEAGLTLSDLNENADLLWIQRKKYELWLPPEK